MTSLRWRWFLVALPEYLLTNTPCRLYLNYTSTIPRPNIESSLGRVWVTGTRREVTEPYQPRQCSFETLMYVLPSLPFLAICPTALLDCPDARLPSHFRRFPSFSPLRLFTPASQYPLPYLQSTSDHRVAPDTRDADRHHQRY